VTPAWCALVARPNWLSFSSFLFGFPLCASLA
jgi:hypothetical protein